MAQYGFYFDQGRCYGCHACTLACKSWHNLPAGPLKYLKIYEYEKGNFPDIRLHYQFVPCFHCARPVCTEQCPNGAIYRDDRFGAVLIDSGKCDGCRLCYDACPYGSPVFASDDAGEKARKCDMCIDRLREGNLPVCVLACRTRALDFGPLELMEHKYGSNRQVEDMPDCGLTLPSVIARPHSAKKLLVPYDSHRALEVMARRDPLPKVYDVPEDILNVTRQIIGRHTLVLKHKNNEELMRHTRDDES